MRDGMHTGMVFYAEVRCMLYDALRKVRYAGRAGGTECRYEVCATQICQNGQICAMQQAKLAIALKSRENYEKWH